jgi:hypothetical protein
MPKNPGSGPGFGEYRSESPIVTWKIAVLFSDIPYGTVITHLDVMILILVVCDVNCKCRYCTLKKQ